MSNDSGTRVPNKIRIGDTVQVGPDNAVVARGVVTGIRTPLSIAKTATPADLEIFIHEKRAVYGPSWRDVWYSVCVGFRWYDAPLCKILQRGSVVIHPTKPLV